MDKTFKKGDRVYVVVDNELGIGKIERVYPEGHCSFEFDKDFPINLCTFDPKIAFPRTPAGKKAAREMIAENVQIKINGLKAVIDREERKLKFIKGRIARSKE